MPKKITPEEYRKYFEEHYPDYELLTDYNGNKNYITVRCKIDGYTWNTKPNWLQHGAGCQKCYDRRRGETTRIGTDNFIKRAKEIHGDKYDYSKVNYINSHTPVTLSCPKHGDFLAIPHKHLNRGDGCPKCADEQNGINKRISKEKFVEKSISVHGNKYDYSKADYQGWDKPVIITCPKHGDFVQIAGTHMGGCGCPYCNESHLEKETKLYLDKYDILCERQKRFKWLGKQSLDFYLPEYNIAIECQGIQHYSDYYFNWDSQSELPIILKRDEIKNELCKQNGIEILYYCKKREIVNISTIYTKENTFTNIETLISKIKTLKENTLFHNIIKEVLNG